MLRKCAVFYSTIGNNRGDNWLDKDVDELTKMNFIKIRSQLLPMLRIKAGAYPKERIEQAVSDYVKLVMKLDNADKEFIGRFHTGDYRPDILFGVQSRHLLHHPVVLATLSKIK